MFSQRMASLPPRWAARLKALGGNAPGISFSSLRPVPHYPCAVLTTSLPLLLRPSVGNQCFFGATPAHHSVFPLQGHKYTLELICSFHSSFSAVSPPAAADPDPWEKEPFAPLARVGFPQLRSCVSEVVCILFYPI